MEQLFLFIWKTGGWLVVHELVGWGAGSKTQGMYSTQIWSTETQRLGRCLLFFTACSTFMTSSRRATTAQLIGGWVGWRGGGTCCVVKYGDDGLSHAMAVFRVLPPDVSVEVKEVLFLF